MQAFGLHLFRESADHSDEPMTVDEASVARHLLEAPPHLVQSSLSAASKPLPYLPPHATQATPHSNPAAHPTFSLNNVPIVFGGQTRLAAPIPASGNLSLQRIDTHRRAQRSRSRSHSPRAPEPPSLRSVEGGHDDSTNASGQSKIRLVSIEDPTKDALITTLTEQVPNLPP